MHGSQLIAALVLAMPAPAWALDTNDETPSAPSFGYDRGFFIQTADRAFGLKINLWGDVRFTFSSEESADGSRDNGYAFSVPRARLFMGGPVFGQALRYKLHVGSRLYVGSRLPISLYD